MFQVGGENRAKRRAKDALSSKGGQWSGAAWSVLAVLLLYVVAGLNFAMYRFGGLDSPHVQPAQTMSAVPATTARRPWLAMAQRELLIPVDGIRADDLADTWGQARSEGRSHRGIDILAPRFTSVRAAADGQIVRLFDSQRGGITIYQYDARERYVFYYAHLEARAHDLIEGAHVSRGQVIGYVGASGNATTPHLHFEIQRLGAERQWWRAESVNPYPYLLSGEAPKS